MSKVNVLGVKVDDVDLSTAMAVAEKWVVRDLRKYYIVTPNPEILVAAQKDNELKKALNDADLSIPDGKGLKLSGKIKNTLSGVRLMEELIKLSAQKGFTIGLLGGKKGVAEDLAECLLKKYPGLKVEYALEGPVIPAKAGIYANKDLWIPDQVRDDKVDVLFVAFGHGKQEKWIANNLSKIPVKVSMGVGGSFDELSGRLPRIPDWIHQLGFKWFIRLILEPWRIKRQLVLFEYVWLLVINR